VISPNGRSGFRVRIGPSAKGRSGILACSLLTQCPMRSSRIWRSTDCRRREPARGSSLCARDVLDRQNSTSAGLRNGTMRSRGTSVPRLSRDGAGCLLLARQPHCPVEINCRSRVSRGRRVGVEPRVHAFSGSQSARGGRTPLPTSRQRRREERVTNLRRHSPRTTS